MAAITPLYNDGTNDVPIPFTYNRAGGILDVEFSTTFTTSSSIQSNETIYIMGSTFSDNCLVKSLGDNIKTWLENRLSADAGSVELYGTNPIVVKAIQLQPQLDPNSVGSYRSSLTSPVDFGYISGLPENNYNSTYLFKRPLVVKYLSSGTPRYAILASQIGEANT
jgi:hypothetical protein